MANQERRVQTHGGYDAKYGSVRKEEEKFCLVLNFRYVTLIKIITFNGTPNCWAWFNEAALAIGLRASCRPQLFIRVASTDTDVNGSIGKVYPTSLPLTPRKVNLHISLSRIVGNEIGPYSKKKKKWGIPRQTMFSDVGLMARMLHSVIDKAGAIFSSGRETNALRDGSTCC